MERELPAKCPNCGCSVYIKLPTEDFWRCRACGRHFAELPGAR